MTTVLSRVSIVLIILSLIFMAAYPVWAEESTTGATRQDKVKQRIETAKENIQERISTLKERMATKEASLRAKLQNFRDQKKATAAARISENLGRINSQRTEQMLKHLDKMTTILNRLENRVNQATSDIKDPTEARAAIADARSAIASATAAVRDQAEKDYTLEVSVESKVRADAMKVREKLHADLLAVRKLVIDAKQAVANAIRVAKSGAAAAGTGLMRKEGTPSGQ